MSNGRYQQRSALSATEYARRQQESLIATLRPATGASDEDEEIVPGEEAPVTTPIYASDAPSILHQTEARAEVLRQRVAAGEAAKRELSKLEKVIAIMREEG